MEGLNNKTCSSKEPEGEKFLFTEETDEIAESRETWGNRLEFLLALIGYTVGIGSIWRFPMLCIRNGGVAFLIPVSLILVVIGGPLYYLEINLGQFTGKGVAKAYEFCPLFKGTGYLVLTLAQLLIWYLMIILAWIIYYFFTSFKSPLPWSTCNNEWNTPNCNSGINESLTQTRLNMTNETNSNMYMNNKTTNSASLPAVEFWKYNVLQQSDGLENMGSIQIHLALCLLLAWTLSILGVIKGVKSLGKVVYVTALFPYVLLTILLVRGLTLDGAADGLLYFLKFESYRLTTYQTWLDASVQVFYSLGPLWGGVITMSSHNKFNQQTFKDTIIICAADMFTAVYASLIVFSTIGFMAKQSGIPIAEIATSSGPGLAFIAYPTAISMMPVPRLWAVLFFLMLMLVILDSNFGFVETIVCALMEQFPRSLGRRRVLVNLVFGAVMFIASLVFTTNGGVYLFQLMDWYCSAFGLVIGACLEVSSLSLIYGIDRFSVDIAMMTGRPMSKLSRFLYCIIIPITTLITVILMLTQYNEATYGDNYKYKPYAIAIGFTLGLLPLFSFFVCAVVTLLQESGSFIQRLRSSLLPSKQWGPKDRKAALLYKQNPYVYDTTWDARLKTNLFGSKGTSLF